MCQWSSRGFARVVSGVCSPWLTTAVGPSGVVTKNSGFEFGFIGGYYVSPEVDNFEARCGLWGLGAVLHAGLGVFLEKVADVDCEAFEFFVESLAGTETECFARARNVAIVALQRFRDDSAFVIIE